MLEIRASKAPGEIKEFLPKKSKSLNKTKKDVDAEALTILKHGNLKKTEKGKNRIFNWEECLQAERTSVLCTEQSALRSSTKEFQRTLKTK